MLVMGVGCLAAAISLAALAVSRGWVIYLIALTACGFTMGLVYAFTTVPTQAAVRPERAGEAAGVALTSLVTLAGVGVAVSGTMLEVLTRTRNVNGHRDSGHLSGDRGGASACRRRGARVP
jgi:MFS family permease